MTHRIGVIAGDGIGPEVVAQGIKALDATGVAYTRVDLDLGADRYLRDGTLLPEVILDQMRAFDAIFFGAVGDPRVAPGILERELLLRMRFGMDLYVNVRPVKLYPNVPTTLAGRTPDQIDFVVVRENVEGLYGGVGGTHARGTAGEVAVQESINTRTGIERVLAYAYELAVSRASRLTLVHKTNILTYAGDLWMRAFTEMNERYPGVRTDYCHVDAACLYMVMDPERFDVIVTDNMFGDILTDLGAGITGGLGLAPSGNLNPNTKTSMFEPVHGSAPDIAGRGWANPIAAILCVRMMLDHLGEPAAASRVENAAALALSKMHGMAGPAMGFSTDEIGDMVAEAI